MPHRLFASNSVVDYVANVFETVYMHCKLFLTHSYQNDLPSKFNYGHWIGNVVLELDRVGLLLALLLLFLGALCVFSWPSGRINNGAERFRRGTLFRWKMNRASMFSFVGLFYDYLIRNNTLETLDGGLERRSGGIKKSRTGESSGEKVRALFLDFILFAFIFTDVLFF